MRPHPFALSVLIPLVSALVGCHATARIPGSTKHLAWTPPTPSAAGAPASAVAPAHDDPEEAAVTDNAVRLPREENEEGALFAVTALRVLEDPLGGYRDDCSGFVCEVYGALGVAVEGNTASLWEMAESAGTVHFDPIPDLGDLVFFDDTWDKNGNRKLDDPLTHIGVVVALDEDGTMTVAHAGTGVGRATMRMNLLYPDERESPTGALLNDYLRRPSNRDTAETPRLAGQLWRGFATLAPSGDATADGT